MVRTVIATMIKPTKKSILGGLVGQQKADNSSSPSQNQYFCKCKGNKRVGNHPESEPEPE